MESKEDKKKSLQFYGKYMGLAMEMFGILLLAALGGRWLDNRFDTPRPYITVVLVLIGLAGVLYKMINDLSKQ